MADEQKTIQEQPLLDYDTIVEQAKQEIRESRDFVRPKRIAFRSRLKLYNNQRKQTDKVGDTSIFNIHTTMMAIYYSDELMVKFMGREPGDMSIAANAEMAAKFDHDEMEMDVVNYTTQWDRFFFGVGLRQLSAWDKRRKCPVPKSLDALSWLPDPRGYLLAKNFRYMGFEVEYTKNEMTEDQGFFNLDLLKEKSARQGTEAENTRNAYREAQGLDDIDYQSNKNADNISYDMVDWFMRIKGSDGVTRKYLVTFNDEVTEIFRCEEIQPVTEAEKEDPSLVPWPVALNYYMPTRTDPFGVSVPDLCEDKQRAKSIFKNLRIAAEKANILSRLYKYIG